MYTQKIQTIKDARGFTLVELIVVITILVILGTIAFLNLGGMSAGARDSQRTSDLNQISQQIMTMQAKNGLTYMAMLSGTVANSLTGIANLGGTGITSGSYAGGDVNYTVLGIDATKFQDPVTKTPYEMGGTSIAGGSYEVATKLEESSTALVMGTFKSRSTQAAGTIISTGASNTITLNTSDTGKFFVNDIVGNGAYTGVINKIILNNPNGITLSLSVAPTTTGSLNLGATDTLGLIRGTGSVSAITNKGTNLPY
jgi:prepilin-type N-terminal cleavage/methylation domain-containing protein